MNLKQDRQGVRTPSDIERKYNLGDIYAVADVAANAQRAATNAQSVAGEANATATRANATAEQANNTANAANATAAQANNTANAANATSGQANNAANAANAAAAAAQTAVATLGENVYTKEQTLSSEAKTQLGLSDTATPSDAFAALGQAAQYTAGNNISVASNVISVLTTDEAESDNTRPITSAGVYALIGDIEALLSKI